LERKNEKDFVYYRSFFLTVYNLSGTERITGLKYKHKFSAIKFYLQDDQYNRDYGYYEINLIADDVTDNTVEPYKDLVNRDLIKRYAVSYQWWKWSSLGMRCRDIRRLFFGGFTWVLADSYHNPGQYRTEWNTKDDLQNTRNACTAGIVLCGILIVITCALIGMFAYNVANCIKIKKQILNILNDGSISMLDNRSVKVSFGIDAKYDQRGGSL
jgi:hypothetical protein